MSGRIRLFSWLDAVVAAFLLAGVALAIPVVKSHTPDIAVIYKGNRVIAEYPLQKAQTIRIEGAVGPMEIRIANNSVYVAATTCRHQICRNASPIRHALEQIVCAPNNILITIRGSSERGAPDALAR